MAKSKVTARSETVSLDQCNPGDMVSGDTMQSATALPWDERDWHLKSKHYHPMSWWRAMPARFFGHAEWQLIDETLSRSFIFTGLGWDEMRQGDSQACIAFAMRMLPIERTTINVDLAMSALLKCAIGYDVDHAGAATVLSHILRIAPLRHDYGNELSSSWAIRNLEHSLRSASGVQAEAIKQKIFDWKKSLRPGAF